MGYAKKRCDWLGTKFLLYSHSSIYEVILSIRCCKSLRARSHELTMPVTRLLESSGFELERGKYVRIIFKLLRIQYIWFVLLKRITITDVLSLLPF